MNGVTYRPNNTAIELGFIDTDRKVGVFADEVERVLPEAVKSAPFDVEHDEHGKEQSISGKEYKTVQYEKLVPLLIEAIKELTEKVERLEKGR